MKRTLSTLEYIVYILLNVFTLGTAWFIKIIIKKAVNESNLITKEK